MLSNYLIFAAPNDYNKDATSGIFSEKPEGPFKLNHARLDPKHCRKWSIRGQASKSTMGFVHCWQNRLAHERCNYTNSNVNWQYSTLI